VRRSLQVAEAAGLPCVVSSALETSVGLAAQLALAGALPELDFACGLGTLSLFEGDVVPNAESFRPVDGYLPVPRTPPVPDARQLDAYELTDSTKAGWWRDRLSRVRVELDRAGITRPSG
jgi:O-succinylbenzoate synthase